MADQQIRLAQADVEKANAEAGRARAETDRINAALYEKHPQGPPGPPPKYGEKGHTREVIHSA